MELTRQHRWTAVRQRAVARSKRALFKSESRHAGPLHDFSRESRSSFVAHPLFARSKRRRSQLHRARSRAERSRSSSPNSPLNSKVVVRLSPISISQTPQISKAVNSRRMPICPARLQRITAYQIEAD